MMIDILYTPEILSLAANITKTELLKTADIYCSKKTKLCGSSIIVNAKLNNDKIIDYGQELKACVLTQASSAILANLVINSTYANILSYHNELENIVKAKIYKSKNFEVFINAYKFPEKHEAILLPFKAIIEAFNDVKKI